MAYQKMRDDTRGAQKWHKKTVTETVQKSQKVTVFPLVDLYLAIFGFSTISGGMIVTNPKVDHSKSRI